VACWPGIKRSDIFPANTRMLMAPAISIADFAISQYSFLSHSPSFVPGTALFIITPIAMTRKESIKASASTEKSGLGLRVNELEGSEQEEESANDISE
jgi:hypothetical protein